MITPHKYKDFAKRNIHHLCVVTSSPVVSIYRLLDDPSLTLITTLTLMRRFSESDLVAVVPPSKKVHDSKLPDDASKLAQNLHDNGYIVISLGDYLESGQREKVRLGMVEYLRSAPERDPDAGVPQYPLTLGGFAALGNASSFQQPLLRAIEKCYYETLRPTLAALADKLGLERERSYVQLLMDRYLYRRPGQAPQQEAWHRDVFDPNAAKKNDAMAEAPRLCDEVDIIFGGGLNLDEGPQYFSLVPGSHAPRGEVSVPAVPVEHVEDTATSAEDSPRPQKKRRTTSASSSGFANIPKEEHAYWNSRKVKVVVPPGHAIVFYQTIVHEVLPTARKDSTMHRHFLGARLCAATSAASEDAPASIIDYTKVFEDGAVPLLPSGQIAPLYSPNHGSAFIEKPFCSAGKGSKKCDGLIGWSRQFRKEFHVQKIRGSGPKKGVGYSVVARRCKSLRQAGLSEHIMKWTNQQRQLYYPHRVHPSTSE